MTASKIYYILFLIVLAPQISSAQENGNWVLSEIQYGIQAPQSDFGQRFGTHFVLGSRITYFSENRISLGIQYQFLFGANVKEDVLSPLRSADGSIISNGFQPTFPSLKLRGHGINLLFGKWFTSDAHDRGFWIQAGPGFLQHKINIQDNIDPVAQLFGEYRKGYDRLSNGFGIVGSIGYQLITKNRQISFHFSAQGGYFLTKNRRGFNIDLNAPDTQRHSDALIGLHAGWIIPLFLDK